MFLSVAQVHGWQRIRAFFAPARQVVQVRTLAIKPVVKPSNPMQPLHDYCEQLRQKEREYHFKKLEQDLQRINEQFLKVYEEGLKDCFARALEEIKKNK